MTDARLKEYLSLEVCTMDLLLTPVGALDQSQELATAVRVALGTDALADADEEIPDLSNDRRGWWGDLDAEEIWDGWSPIGCKNWLLTRAKITDINAREGGTLERAKIYTQKALQPLIDLAVCSRIDVSAARTELERIEVIATIYRGPLPEIALRYQLLWDEIINPPLDQPSIVIAGPARMRARLPISLGVSVNATVV